MAASHEQHRSNGTRTGGLRGQGGPPVRNLLQVHLLVAVKQLRDIVTDDPHQEGDEDDGQDHPQTDAGVQQELGTTHCPLSNLWDADTKTGASTPG